MNKADLTRWSWVEIDRGALRRNTRAYKNLLNPRQRLCCVVKADAYGHGAVECAKIMYSAGADMFAVATVNEGVELRQGGITKSILILSEPPIEAIPTLLEFDIMPSVYTSDFALAYGECAVAAGKVGKYHLAIETGMNRIGVHYTQVLDFVRGINFHRGIQCDGVFTHFATADEPSGWDYKLQCQRFTEAVQAIKDAGFECGIVHCANTPSSMLDPSMHFDMIRAGVGLYGMQPCELSGRVMQLDPVMSVHARVTRVAHPAMGEGVGYGFTYRVPRTRVQICTLPIGYADGLDRHFSNGGGEVVINGHRCPIIGNICMDACMIDVTDTDAHEGDSVIIFGEELPVSELSDKLKTIPYEILTSISPRVKRVYYRE